LVDRTEETAYRLNDVREALRQADYWDDQGNRAAAVAIYEGARAKLPEGHERERRYIDVLICATWGRWGDGRDEKKAMDARARAMEGMGEDLRLSGDMMLALAAIYLGANETGEAAIVASKALAAFEAAQAWGCYTDASREITTGFRDAGDSVTALKFARGGADTARRLGDSVRMLRAEADIARCLMPDDPAGADEAFQRAYFAVDAPDELPWRNVVISAAVESFQVAGNHALAVKWGERLRDSMSGDLPDLKQTGLRPATFAGVMARYALALHALRPEDARLQAALEHAQRALEALEQAAPGQAGLLESVKAALLQIGAGK
jgi:hypothetical protein